MSQLAPSSKAGNLNMLNRVARLISGGLLDAEVFPWHLLDYATMSALRAALVSGAPWGEPLNHRTASNILTAVRGILKRCKKLGMMTAEAYENAVDIEKVKGESLPAGRAPSSAGRPGGTMCTRPST